MHNEIELVIKESGLEQSTASAIEQKFLPLFKQAAEWKEKALSLVVTEEGDKDKMKQAREARLFLKGIRVSAEKVKKELKQDSLRYGRAVEGVYNVIEYLIVPIEEHLEKQENYDKIKAEERRNQLRIDRTELAKPLAEFLPIGLDFGIMTEEDFEKLISGAQAQKKFREEEERKEQERWLEEQARMQKQKEIDNLHHERMKTISGLLRWMPADKKDVHLGMLEEEDWNWLQDELNKSEAAYNKKQDEIRKENERLRKEQEKAAEQRKKEQAEQQKKLDEERKAREKAEKELADKKAEEARLEAERVAAAEEQLKKGDRDKFDNYMADLNALKEKYQFKSKKYNTLYSACNDLIDKIINYAKSKQ